MSHDFIYFENCLEDDDYGIVVGRDGSLKGIWVPKGLENEADVPSTIARVCIEHFGLDPNDKSNYGVIH
jgi:hypothetical protein